MNEESGEKPRQFSMSQPGMGSAPPGPAGPGEDSAGTGEDGELAFRTSYLTTPR